VYVCVCIHARTITGIYWWLGSQITTDLSYEAVATNDLDG
jgi:hypothetical protein